jgi:3-keto-disaccharide hydrolase
MPRAVLLVTLVLCVPSALAEDPKSKTPDWKPLFDGKTLDGWKASFDKDTSGKVHVKDGAIVLEKGMKMTGVTYTGKEFPRADYEVVLEGKRVDGRDFFATTTFPVGDGYCSLVVGGWGGMLVGVSSINGSDASENETTGSIEFKENSWYKIRIRVTENKLECWIGDEKVVDVERKGRKFSTRIECDDCQPFGIATYDTVGAVRDIKVRRLTEAEKKVAAEKK